MTKYELFLFVLLWFFSGWLVLEHYRVKTYLEGCKIGWWLHEHKQNIDKKSLKETYGIEE